MENYGNGGNRPKCADAPRATTKKIKKTCTEYALPIIHPLVGPLDPKPNFSPQP